MGDSQQVTDGRRASFPIILQLSTFNAAAQEIVQGGVLVHRIRFDAVPYLIYSCKSRSNDGRIDYDVSLLFIQVSLQEVCCNRVGGSIPQPQFFDFANKR